MTNTGKSRSSVAAPERDESTQNTASTVYEARFDSTMTWPGIARPSCSETQGSSPIDRRWKQHDLSALPPGGLPGDQGWSGNHYSVDALRQWLNNQAVREV